MPTSANTRSLPTLSGPGGCLDPPQCLAQDQVRFHQKSPSVLCYLHYSRTFIVGGNIASSWAVLQCMGEDGYMDIARRLMLVADRMKNGINAIEVIKQS